MFKNFYAPTPKRFRQLGDFFLVMIPVIQGGLIAAPDMSDSSKYWVGFIATIVLTAAKFATNLAKEDEGGN